MIFSQNEDFVTINGRVTKSVYEQVQKVSKSLDLSLSSFIASSIKEYLHQVTSEKGSQTVELEVARIAYENKISPKE